MKGPGDLDAWRRDYDRIITRLPEHLEESEENLTERQEADIDATEDENHD